MSLNHYRIITAEKINTYAGNPLISDTILSDGTYRSLIQLDGDADFLEECLEADDNVLAYSPVYDTK